MKRQQQQQQDNRPFSGWLWRRLAATNSWERFYCRCSAKKEKLSLFTDDKEEELADVIPLSQAVLSELPFHEAAPAGASGRHSRGLLLRVAAAGPGPVDELGPEAESLLYGRHGGGLLAGPRQEVLLAAEDSRLHQAWLKRLGRLCSNRARLQEEGGEGRQARPYSTCIRSPPQEVLRQLCGPGLLRGRQLMERLRFARWQLEAGLRDLSAVRDEARSAQRPLSDLHGVLLDMGQGVDVHHADVTQEPALGALRACQDWLQGAVTFVMEVDQQLEALIYAEPGSNVTAEWAMLAHNTLLQLRDIEEAMRAEELRQLQALRLAAAAASGGAGAGGSPCCCRSFVTAPAMPYASWWAGKVAL